MTDFRNFLKYQKPRKPINWEPSYFVPTDRGPDRQTDMAKLIVAYHNFLQTRLNILLSAHTA